MNSNVCGKNSLIFKKKKPENNEINKRTFNILNRSLNFYPNNELNLSLKLNNSLKFSSSKSPIAKKTSFFIFNNQEKGGDKEDLDKKNYDLDNYLYILKKKLSIIKDQKKIGEIKLKQIKSNIKDLIKKEKYISNEFINTQKTIQAIIKNRKINTNKIINKNINKKEFVYVKTNILKNSQNNMIKNNRYNNAPKKFTKGFYKNPFSHLSVNNYFNRNESISFKYLNDKDSKNYGSKYSSPFSKRSNDDKCVYKKIKINKSNSKNSSCRNNNNIPKFLLKKKLFLTLKEDEENKRKIQKEIEKIEKEQENLYKNFTEYN